jgi:phosphate/sulfate permease
MTETSKNTKREIVVNINLTPIAERHAVTAAVFILAGAMLLMAREDPKLWDIELFKIILQAVIISGIFGAIVAFHFSANKTDEIKAQNTAKAFDAIKAASAPVSADIHEAATQAADQVAQAADKEAELIGKDK